GGRLVARDSTRGESHSSPNVATSMISAIHSTGTDTTDAIGRNSRKAEPMRMMPTPNFRGVPGWRVPSFVHSAANSGERVMMKNGLKDCTHEIGIVQPSTSRFKI